MTLKKHLTTRPAPRGTRDTGVHREENFVSHRPTRTHSDNNHRALMFAQNLREAETQWFPIGISGRREMKGKSGLLPFIRHSHFHFERISSLPAESSSAPSETRANEANGREINSSFNSQSARSSLSCLSSQNESKIEFEVAHLPAKRGFDSARRNGTHWEWLTGKQKPSFSVFREVCSQWF